MSLSMSEKWICFEFFRPSLASIQRREREREREMVVHCFRQRRRHLARKRKGKMVNVCK
jgi:hypothetical protein